MRRKFQMNCRFYDQSCTVHGSFIRMVRKIVISVISMQYHFVATNYYSFVPTEFPTEIGVKLEFLSFLFCKIGGEKKNFFGFFLFILSFSPSVWLGLGRTIRLGLVFVWVYSINFIRNKYVVNKFLSHTWGMCIWRERRRFQIFEEIDTDTPNSNDHQKYCRWI